MPDAEDQRRPFGLRAQPGEKVHPSWGSFSVDVADHQADRFGWVLEDRLSVNVRSDCLNKQPELSKKLLLDAVVLRMVIDLQDRPAGDLGTEALRPITQGLTLDVRWLTA